MYRRRFCANAQPHYWQSHRCTSYIHTVAVVEHTMFILNTLVVAAAVCFAAVVVPAAAAVAVAVAVCYTFHHKAQHIKHMHTAVS